MDYKKDYYVGEAHKELKRGKERAELFAEAWQGVKRLRKKDGSDFANLKNNFEGCFFKASYSRGQDLEVSIHSDNIGYDSDWIDTTPSVSKYDEKRKEYEEQGRIIDGGCLADYVILTPDEIEEKAKERARYWLKVVADYEDALERFDEVASKLVEMREEAKAYIDTLPQKYVFKTIFDERK